MKRLRPGVYEIGNGIIITNTSTSIIIRTPNIKQTVIHKIKQQVSTTIGTDIIRLDIDQSNNVRMVTQKDELRKEVNMEKEIMEYLRMKVFIPITSSHLSSNKLKKIARIAESRMSRLKANSMIKYFWSAIANTDKSNSVFELIKKEGFTSFEDVLPEFRSKFVIK